MPVIITDEALKAYACAEWDEFLCRFDHLHETVEVNRDGEPSWAQTAAWLAEARWLKWRWYVWCDAVVTGGRLDQEAADKLAFIGGYVTGFIDRCRSEWA